MQVVGSIPHVLSFPSSRIHGSLSWERPGDAKIRRWLWGRERWACAPRAAARIGPGFALHPSGFWWLLVAQITVKEPKGMQFGFEFRSRIQRPGVPNTKLWRKTQNQWVPLKLTPNLLWPEGAVQRQGSDLPLPSQLAWRWVAAPPQTWPDLATVGATSHGSSDREKSLT